jgi:hypothetical protein
MLAKGDVSRGQDDTAIGISGASMVLIESQGSAAREPFA